jgi:pimeloyl-ACP methyl ester carboxylesterase
VLDVGPDDAKTPPGPAVVLVHGANANLGDMRIALVGRLRTRHRVIAIDRPGHGWSERGGAADATPRRQAAVLGEVLDKLDVTRPVLVGHSWGGALAAAYAADRPGALSGLLLLAPAMYPRSSSVLWFFAALDTPVLGPLLAGTAAQPFGYLMLQRIAGRAFAPQSAPPGYIEAASIPLALRPATLLANGADLDQLAPRDAAQTIRYAQIGAPTVIITGNEDQVVAPRINARVMAAQIPQAQLVVLRGIGHMPHHAAPGRVVAAIEALANAATGATAAPAARP